MKKLVKGWVASDAHQRGARRCRNCPCRARRRARRGRRRRRRRSCQSPSAVAVERRAQRAHRARRCAARPRLRAGRVTRVRPTASAPRMSARCEIDLSPGTRQTTAERARRVPEVSGVMAVPDLAQGCSSSTRGQPARAVAKRSILLLTAAALSWQRRAASRARDWRRDVVKPEWGTKRICPNCGARYYDLRRDPIVCPKCGAPIDPEALLKTRRAASRPRSEVADRAVAEEEIETELAEEVEPEVEVEGEEVAAKAARRPRPKARRKRKKRRRSSRTPRNSARTRTTWPR